jgi:hypothetical protein
MESTDNQKLTSPIPETYSDMEKPLTPSEEDGKLFESHSDDIIENFEDLNLKEGLIKGILDYEW